MAKINARLADIETKYEQVRPDRYRILIKEVKSKTEGGRQNVNFELAINDAGDFQGRPMYQNCALHKLDGSPNEIGLRDFKRIAIGALGISEEDQETYDWDSLDTDDLKLKEFEADVVIAPWVNEKKGTKGESPVIKTHTITPVQ